MTWPEWIATALGIVCVALAAVRSVWTFPAGIGSVALVGIVVFEQRLYSDAVLQGFFIAANLYGLWAWKAQRAAAGEIVVGRMQPWAIAGTIVAIVVAAIFWGWTMHTLFAASYPYWDATIAMASVAAQILMARRKLENWMIWIAVDVASIPLYAAKHLWPFVGLYVIYLGLAVWGLVDWHRARRGVGPVVA